ncbi:YrhB domain-containing protein [Stenotrophomonas indicatrix]|uniref:YrhB domain-containing protein n=1 Tax=Stenotrophomonas indicatrix TaxID=2045451 RepID=UPI0032090DFA
MIDFEEAMRRAVAYLEDSDVPVRVTSWGEFSDGWYFCYQSVEYLDTGEFSAQLAGNAPFVIDRESGDIFDLGTDKPVEVYIVDYMAGKLGKGRA